MQNNPITWIVRKITDELVSRLRERGCEVSRREVVTIRIDVDSKNAEEKLANLKALAEELADVMKRSRE